MDHAAASVLKDPALPYPHPADGAEAKTIQTVLGREQQQQLGGVWVFGWEGRGAGKGRY